MKNKKFLLIEILIWVIALSFIGFGGFNALKNWVEGRNYYHVEFRDVDGIIEGSPVRFMGIDIGHIVKVQPLYDKVHIVFVVNKDLTIPKNTVSTIQFTGLAGSKSLELLPQGGLNLKGKKFISIEPIRADSMFDMQNAITNAVLKNSKAMINLFGDNTPKQSRKIVKDVIENSERYIEVADNINLQAININTYFDTHVQSFKQGLQLSNDFLDVSNNTVEKLRTVTKTAKKLKENYTDEKHHALNKKITGLNHSIQRSTQIIKPATSGNFIQRLLHSTDKNAKKIDDFSTTLTDIIEEDNLKKLEEKFKNAKDTTEKMKQRVECSY